MAESLFAVCLICVSGLCCSNSQWRDCQAEKMKSDACSQKRPAPENLRTPPTNASPQHPQPQHHNNITSHTPSRLPHLLLLNHNPLLHLRDKLLDLHRNRHDRFRSLFPHRLVSQRQGFEFGF
ncbi:hypothetical protein BZA70DRAFT_167365 [Myxozyma melibiosi]|uniref:Secreted protein n=1 Tax=Myxozyma melibiosi TaxID=54550 RepID=A0ABR1F788_9ASCO